MEVVKRELCEIISKTLETLLMIYQVSLNQLNLISLPCKRNNYSTKIGAILITQVIIILWPNDLPATGRPSGHKPMVTSLTESRGPLRQSSTLLSNP